MDESMKKINEIIASIDRAYYDNGRSHDAVNDLLTTISFTSETSIDEMNAWVRSTFAGRDKLSEWVRLRDEYKDQLIARGEIETIGKANGYMKGLLD